MFYEMIGGWLVVCVALCLPRFFGSFFGLLEDLGLLLLLGSLFTAYPMTESVALMKNVSPFTLLLNVNLEPVYGIILAYFIFGESENDTALYVATFIMLAVIVVNSLMKAKANQKRKPKNCWKNSIIKFKSFPALSVSNTEAVRQPTSSLDLHVHILQYLHPKPTVTSAGFCVFHKFWCDFFGRSLCIKIRSHPT